jgi:tRNA-dihydrouridine synthase B
MVKIGSIELPAFPLALAPMEDITDPSFRFLCKESGADLLYTEFISSDGLVRKGKKSVQKLNIFDYERPIGIQLYGHEPDPMIEAAKIIEQSNPDFIDINFGCPVKKISNRGAGSGMMKDVPKMVEITSRIVQSVRLPVTVKTRLGWDESSKNIMTVAEQLQDVGIKAITIHARTRSQMFKGEADWLLIGEVKNNQHIKIPVIGNGDIDSPEKAKLMFDRFGIDGIMIGRATIGRPWIFNEIKHFLNSGDKFPDLSVRQKVEIALKHFRKSIEYKGQNRGIYEMRRHFVSYFKSIPNFKETRLKLLTSNNYDEIVELLNYIGDNF